MLRIRQQSLFGVEPEVAARAEASSTTFIDNMRLPVHRWIRYSAGFSADWVSSLIRDHRRGDSLRMFDPFAGSGTTLLAAEQAGIESCGLEAHPFVVRMAQAKLDWRSDAQLFKEHARVATERVEEVSIDLEGYNSLIRNCYDKSPLAACIS